MAAFKESNGSVTVRIKVVPRASKTVVTGMEGEAVKIRLKAPPVEGRANEALAEFLADLMDLPKSHVEIVSGHTARTKVVRIRGKSASQVEGLLLG